MLLRFFGCVSVCYVTGNFAWTTSEKKARAFMHIQWIHAHMLHWHIKTLMGWIFRWTWQSKRPNTLTHIHADRNKCNILLLITTTCNFIWGICFCTALFQRVFCSVSRRRRCRWCCCCCLFCVRSYRQSNNDVSIKIMRCNKIILSCVWMSEWVCVWFFCRLCL